MVFSPLLVQLMRFGLKSERLNLIPMIRICLKILRIVQSRRGIETSLVRANLKSNRSGFLGDHDEKTLEDAIDER